MFTGINPRSATPVYLQIAESVRRSLASGEAVPGDALPSVKALSARLRVSPAMVTHAYRELVRDGIAESDGEGSQQVVRIVRVLPLAPRSVSGAESRSGAATLPMRGAQLEALARLEPGETIDGRFQIRRLLGAGAMGAVYLAHDLELDEDVALKVLPPLSGDDETAVRRFLNEIRIARRISHQNVVRTHDVGRWPGGLFLTMEYVPGRTLREVLDTRGALPAAEVLLLAAQLVDALVVVAHEQGVIHRDVKPQNLLIDATGALKVLDFGIALVLGTGGQLTEAGLVVGTPAYMAPEQLLGESLTPAADLYSAGVVIYEALTGRLPYEATSPMALVAQIVERGPRAIGEVSPDLDPRVAALVMRLLQTDPTRRPSSATELAEALRSLG